MELLALDRVLPMQKIYDGNFYELTLPEARPRHRLRLPGPPPQGDPVDHCDPYGFGMELRPDHRSVVRDLDEYTFGDDAWRRRPLRTRRRAD